MHGVIDKRVVYNLDGKHETIVHTAKVSEKIASGVDGYEFAYDYNYDMTEDDSYYEPNTHSNNDNTTIDKHDTGKKSHLTLNFSGFSFVAFAISSVLLSAS
ncbi:MAG: hypothetical protein ACJ72X_15880 [Nitrososphaeraceae archaeon]